MEEYLISAKASDVTPLFIGREACEPAHSYGPYIRDCYIVHFCLNGCGTLTNRQGTFKINEGQFFVIREGEVTTYTADRDNPWEYVWIAFRSGERCFGGDVSVFDTPHGLDDRLTEIIAEGSLSREGCLAVIYDIIYHTSHPRQTSQDNERVRIIRRYIRYNYMRPITVNSIAESFGFERSYLYRAFKARYGIGIKEYITSVRMEKAEEFLRRGYTVKESAQMVGYADEFNFSKAFKARCGVSPSRIGK